MKVLTVCLNPTFQNTLRFTSFKIGEVNRASEHYLDSSGKGMNTARIVSQLGEQSMLLTHLGGPRAREMLNLCRKDKVEIIWADSKSEIRTCTTILADGKATELVEEPYAVDSSTEEPIRALYSEAIERSDALIICGTRAPGYSPNLYADFVKEAKTRGLFVLLDLKGEDLKRCLPFGPDIIKPNLSEAAQTFLGRTVGEQEDTASIEISIKPVLEDIYRSYHTTTVLSRGKEDAWVQAAQFFSVPIERVNAVNTIGCGDSLSAALTVSLYKGTNLQQAVEYATKVATKNAKTVRPGTIF
jgi:1-phosphofructokinase family hexose kinase